MRNLIALLLLCSLPAFSAAFGAGTAWDIRTAANSGADTNGGGFDSGQGSCGTDESGGAGTAITITLTATTTGTGSPAFTSTTHGPCNFVHIASGTGCTVGWYEILSQSSGTATFNTAMGSNTNVCVGVVGGSLLTMAQAVTNAVASNSIYMQTGTYTVTTFLITAVQLKFIGYLTSHDDLNTLTSANAGTPQAWGTYKGNLPVISTTTNSFEIFAVHGGGPTPFIFQNINFTNTSGTIGGAINAYDTYASVVVANCVFNGFTTAINTTNSALAHLSVINSEFSAYTASGVSSSSTFGMAVHGCYFHGGTSSTGYGVAGPAAVSNSVFYNNAGYGVQGNISASELVVNSVFYSNTAGGFYSSGSSGWLAANNVFWNNGIAVKITAGGTVLNGVEIGNAFGSNTTNRGGTGTFFEAQLGDITLSVDPFVSASTGNFALNTSATGGALLAAAGFPGVGPFGTGTMAVGALQTSGAAATSGGAYVQ